MYECWNLSFFQQIRWMKITFHSSFLFKFNDSSFRQRIVFACFIVFQINRWFHLGMQTCQSCISYNTWSKFSFSFKKELKRRLPTNFIDFMNEFKLVHFFSWWTKKIREHSKNVFTFLDKLNICKNESYVFIARFLI